MARTLRWALLLLGLAAVVVIAARQLGRPGPPMSAPVARGDSGERDRMVDEEIDESFPASDAPSHWAGGAD
jgi:hypothetical protein